VEKTGVCEEFWGDTRKWNMHLPSTNNKLANRFPLSDEIRKGNKRKEYPPLITASEIMKFYIKKD
jgi:hypothetical protein